MIDRRSWGIVLLAAVLAIAVIAPVWGGRRVAGVARAVAPAAPPTVGDCLDQVPSRRSALEFMPPLMAARTGACGTDNTGEIFYLASDVNDFPRSTRYAMSTPEVLACDPIMRRYIGWSIPTSDGAGDSLLGVVWRPWIIMSAGLIGPTLQQYFAGQRWVACVAYPQFAPFQGSLAGSAGTGESAAAYAACLSDAATAADTAGPCAEPHRTELFGWAANVPPGAELAASCSALIQRVTGMADPTAGGQLSVQVGKIAEPMSPGTAVTSETDRVNCSVTVADQRLLVGTLVGLGDRALPWG